MKEYKSKIKVEAVQIKGDNIKNIDGVEKSKGWKPTGNFHDRFNEEPEEASYYVMGKNDKKRFIRNSNGYYLVKYTHPHDGIHFDIMSELRFLKEFE